MLSFLQIALIMGSLARRPRKGCPLGSADISLAQWPRLCWPEVYSAPIHRAAAGTSPRLGVASTATIEWSTAAPQALGSAPWRAQHPVPEERTQETRDAPLCLLCLGLFLLCEFFHNNKWSLIQCHICYCCFGSIKVSLLHSATSGTHGLRPIPPPQKKGRTVGPHGVQAKDCPLPNARLGQRWQGGHTVRRVRPETAEGHR